MDKVIKLIESIFIMLVLAYLLQSYTHSCSSEDLAMAWLLEAKCDAPLAAAAAKADAHTAPGWLARTNARDALDALGDDPEKLVAACRVALGLNAPKAEEPQ